MELKLIEEGWIKCYKLYLQNLCTWNKCDTLLSLLYPFEFLGVW